MLEQHYEIRIASATQAIRVVEAPKALADVLSVRHGAALLFIERVFSSQIGIPVELLYLYHRGDRYMLYNDLRG